MNNARVNSLDGHEARMCAAA